jgi:hypothetical protein
MRTSEKKNQQDGEVGDPSLLSLTISNNLAATQEQSSYKIV